jgi:hypothetical protein
MIHELTQGEVLAVWSVFIVVGSSVGVAISGLYRKLFKKSTSEPHAGKTLGL